MDKIKKIISSFFIETELVSPVTQTLHNQVVIITGASRGIGKAIAEVLHRAGARLVLVSRHKKELEEAFASHDKKNILFIEADITREKDVQKIITETVDTFGSIDTLINNAERFLDKAL